MTNGRFDVGGEDRSLWQKIKDVALADVSTLVKGIDEETIAELERVLLESDFGVDATLELVDDLERAAERGKVSTEEELRRHLAERILAMLQEADAAAGEPGGGRDAVDADGDVDDAAGADGSSVEIVRPTEGPSVVLVLGVNGAGKTTTVAKLAHRYRAWGDGPLLAAADTFRAGAQDQLRSWAERVDGHFVGGQEGADPASVAYDAVESARNRNAGIVLVDTAGRLHTRRDLMEELEKIDRVTGRLVEGAPHERLLVVDGTSGQNVVHQAREFGKHLELTGLVLTKYDSTARGGTVVAVARELGLPVRFLGTGEGLEDLEIFDAERYVNEVLAGA